MENAADALKLAAWVLIFVTALTITMNAFSQAREGIDSVISMTDREYITTYLPPSGNTERIVGFESIIPAVYRAFKENYKVVFPEYVLYQDDGKDIHSIDLAINGMQDSVKEEFLKRVLYGNNRFTSDVDKKYTKTHFTNLKFNDEGLYSKIQNKRYTETIGVYYEEEVKGASSAPDANKTEKRVITYKEYN